MMKRAYALTLGVRAKRLDFKHTMPAGQHPGSSEGTNVVT